MVAKRIIPCLDVKEGRTVKGINFLSLQDVGDAVELGRMYARQGADELVYLDISATVEGRNTFTSLVERIASNINIPFTVPRPNAKPFHDLYHAAQVSTESVPSHSSAHWE